MADVTQLLSAIEAGDQQASAQLLPLVYQELRALAKARMASEAAGQTLQPTALVHEAYLRLVGSPDELDEPGWNSRGHFFAAAAEAMRRILVENARRKQRSKHGGDFRRVPLDGVAIVEDGRCDEVVAIGEALDRLAATDAQAAELVKLRYFAGLSLAEAADSLGLARRSADRLWAYAKAWLHRELHP